MINDDNKYQRNSKYPLLLKFKRNAPRREIPFKYDEDSKINLVNIGGTTKPAVLVPQSEVWLKTKVQHGPED